MDHIQAAALGLVQGLTEFLPVSSSGHLVLGQKLLGIAEPQLTFDIAVHLGTLAAVAAVYWRDMWDMLRGLWASDDAGRRGRKLLLLVIAGSIPTALMGFLLKDQFEALFASIRAVGCALLFTGALLLITRWASGQGRDLKATGPGRALLVGIAQGLAITPGVSRSGATISVGLLLGIDRELAARLSFLLSVPAILGAVLLQTMETLSNPGVVVQDWGVIATGAVVAAVSGLAALRLLLGVVRAGRLHWFAPYCLLLGAAAVTWSFWG